MTEKLIIAGAGGQGIMLLGKILAEAAMRERRYVTWLPAYGAEVRGGTAHCAVVISEEEIGSPFISKADTLIIMNAPSLHKFQGRIQKKGLMIINSSLLTPGMPVSKDAFRCPFTDRAITLGNIRVANMVALGYYLGKKKTVEAATVRKVIADNAPAGKEELIEINHKALELGIECAYGKSPVCP